MLGRLRWQVKRSILESVILASFLGFIHFQALLRCSDLILGGSDRVSSLIRTLKNQVKIVGYVRYMA